MARRSRARTRRAATARSASSSSTRTPFGRLQIPLTRSSSPLAPPCSPTARERSWVARATYLVEACGGREWTAVRAKANLDAALGALERVRLSAIPHRDLADIAFDSRTLRVIIAAEGAISATITKVPGL